MKIKISRNTGFAGFLMRVNLIVERGTSKDVVKLGNHESCVVDVEKEGVTLSAGIWPFISRKIELVDSQNLEIRTNPVALIMYLISLFIIFTGALIDSPQIKLPISATGLVLIILTFVYSVKSWFVLKKV